MRGVLISETRTIAAPPQTLFDLVADPRMHPVIDGSGSVRALRSGGRGRDDVPRRLSLGATFDMNMRIGAAYQIRNTVIEFDDGRRIAWRHFNGHVWRYLFEPADATGDRTVVTEQWDARPARHKLALVLLGFPRRNRAGIRATLRRLDELATGDEDATSGATG